MQPARRSDLPVRMEALFEDGRDEELRVWCFKTDLPERLKNLVFTGDLPSKQGFRRLSLPPSQ